jgi:hypothetical protein
MSNNFIESLQKNIQAQRELLLQHPVYKSINDLNGLIQFSEKHVYAVWDFMSLLKSLQRDLTCVELPWRPVGTADTRYLINEIVLGEESDVDEHGVRISHFELYLKAMQQMGADTQTIQVFLSQAIDKNIFNAIENAELHPKVKSFLNFTFDVAINQPAHIKAAVFTFGREDLIPDMFVEILREIHQEFPEKVSTFKYYIERHLEVDGDHHSHLALEMVAQLCGNDAQKWSEAEKFSIESLKQRSLLWDAIIDR